VGVRQAIRQVIIVADTGPLLHLFWVGASSWALPPQRIHVVEQVWLEVSNHAPDALNDARFSRVTASQPFSTQVLGLALDEGEQAALSYALAQGDREQVLVLCDETAARRACRRLSIAVTGSIGLVLEAARAGRIPTKDAEIALRELPTRGRLHVRPELIRIAVRALPPS
jgi:predicted nucleic acid-binding protein